MPKLFPMQIEVEELYVGKVWRLLDKMPGVAKMHIDMGGDKTKKEKANGAKMPRKVFATSGNDLVLDLLFSKPQGTGQIRESFISAGRSPASTSSILHELKHSGDIKHDDEGAWILTKKARDRIRGQKKRGK